MERTWGNPGITENRDENEQHPASLEGGHEAGTAKRSNYFHSLPFSLRVNFHRGDRVS